MFVSPSARRVMWALPLLIAWPPDLPSFIEPAAAHDNVHTYRVVYVAPGDVLNLRSGPSVAYPVVGAIPPGGRGVRLVGHCQAWCPVLYNGALGWVNPAYLAPEPASDEPVPPERARGYVAVAPPTLRKHGRLPSYWQVTGVAEGESLKVTRHPHPPPRSYMRSSHRARASSSPAAAKSRGARSRSRASTAIASAG